MHRIEVSSLIDGSFYVEMAFCERRDEVIRFSRGLLHCVLSVKGEKSPGGRDMPLELSEVASVVCRHCEVPLTPIPSAELRQGERNIARCENPDCKQTALLIAAGAKNRATIRHSHCGSGVISCFHSSPFACSFICQMCGEDDLKIAHPCYLPEQSASQPTQELPG